MYCRKGFLCVLVRLKRNNTNVASKGLNGFFWPVTEGGVYISRPGKLTGNINGRSYKTTT